VSNLRSSAGHLLLVVSGLLPACASSPAPAPESIPKAVSEPAGSPDATKPEEPKADDKPKTDDKPIPEAKPEVAQTAALKPLERPKSVHKIGDTSISDVEVAAVAAMLEKAAKGYEVEAGVPLIGGRWESLQLVIRKDGKPAGVVGIIRPAKTPQPTEQDDANFSAKVHTERQKKAGVGEVFYDEAAEVTVIIAMMGKEKPAKAAEIFRALVSKGK
jgi:hypothetical protein